MIIITCDYCGKSIKEEKNNLSHYEMHLGAAPVLELPHKVYQVHKICYYELFNFIAKTVEERDKPCSITE